MNEQLTLYDAIASDMKGSIRDYVSDHWSSDWNGDEVGFPGVAVVGLYSVHDQPIYYYVDTETGNVLEAWAEDLDG